MENSMPVHRTNSSSRKSFWVKFITFHLRSSDCLEASTASINIKNIGHLRNKGPGWTSPMNLTYDVYTNGKKNIQILVLRHLLEGRMVRCLAPWQWQNACSFCDWSNTLTTKEMKNEKWSLCPLPKKNDGCLEIHFPLPELEKKALLFYSHRFGLCMRPANVQHRCVAFETKEMAYETAKHNIFRKHKMKAPCLRG